MNPGDDAESAIRSLEEFAGSTPLDLEEVRRATETFNAIPPSRPRFPWYLWVPCAILGTILHCSPREAYEMLRD